jgi:uncharacterized protein
MPENAKSPPEPSMEEIIASISRIITEDKTQTQPAPTIAAEKNEILELTEALNEDGSVQHIHPFDEKPMAGGEGSRSADEPPKAAADSSAELRASQPDAETEPQAEIGRERIVSAATSGAAAAAFAQLGSLPRDRPREGDLALGAADRTLEEIVRDMLRPLLEAWLNEHLPGIVERLVRQEIARVIGEAGLR